MASSRVDESAFVLRLSGMQRLIPPITALVVALIATPWIAGEFFAYELSLYLLYGIVAQGIALTWGRTGFLSLGQALFFGLGAYIAGHVLRGNFVPTQTVALLCLAAVIPAFIAYAIGRLVFARRHESGPYFALITLALVMFGYQLANQWSSVTGGFNGLGGIPTPFGLDRYGNYYYLVAIACVVSTGFIYWVGNTPLGTLWAAIAQNENRLQFFGYATGKLKAQAFAISALLAGSAGALFAGHQGIVTPQATSVTLSAELVIWTAVGGRRSPLGALLGAVVIGMLSTQLRDHFAYWEAIVAIVFIVVVLRFPNGMAGFFKHVVQGVPGFTRRFKSDSAQFQRSRSLRPDPSGASAAANPEQREHRHDRVGSTACAPEAGAHRRDESPGAAAPAAQLTGLSVCTHALAPPVRYRRGSNVSPATLQYENVYVRQGPVQILAGLNLSVQGPGIFCLIGPNGAGKTSSFNVLTGRLPLAKGNLYFNAERVNGLSADAIARRGLSRKFQIPSVFPELTVHDNLCVAIWAHRVSFAQLLDERIRDWQTPLLQQMLHAFPFLATQAAVPAGALSQGQRQMLEFAMTALTEPLLFLLDEPCAGLSVEETRHLSTVMARTIRELQATALIVEHDMAAVEALADQVYVLHQGQLLAVGSYAEIRRNPTVQATYVGGQK